MKNSQFELTSVPATVKNLFNLSFFLTQRAWKSRGSCGTWTTRATNSNKQGWHHCIRLSHCWARDLVRCPCWLWRRLRSVWIEREAERPNIR